MRWVWLGVGGALGAVLRWLVDAMVPVAPGEFPWVTLMVNVSGAMLLGFIGVALMQGVVRWLHLRAFLAIGVIGSFTTFSTMSVEAVQLADAGHPGRAAAYLAASVVAGIGAALVGVASARRKWRVRRPHDAQG
jgi:CrcB protein